MIYRVVIKDDKGQVSLTQQGNATPYFEVDGNWNEDIAECRNIMVEALDKLKEAIKDEAHTN